MPAIAAMYALGGWDRPAWLRALGLVMPVWMVTGGMLLRGGDVLELTFVGVFLVSVWGWARSSRTVGHTPARSRLAPRELAQAAGSSPTGLWPTSARGSPGSCTTSRTR